MCIQLIIIIFSLGLPRIVAFVNSSAEALLTFSLRMTAMLMNCLEGVGGHLPYEGSFCLLYRQRKNPATTRTGDWCVEF